MSNDALNDDPRSRTALVTGGTDGIGKEIAVGLAAAGHQVLIVGHDQTKGVRAEAEIRRAGANQNVEFLPADLSLMSEAERLAEAATRRFSSLHYLVTSAGVVLGERKLTAEGVETNFALNYLSRFVLTRKLLPLLIRSGQPGATARIVLISGATTSGTVHFDDVNLTTNFGTLRAVGQFCQANDLLTVELARRLIADGERPVTVNCLKMGVVKTNIRRNFPWWMKLLVPLLMDPFIGQTPREAASSALQLLLSEDYEEVTGSLFVKIRELRKVMLSTDALDRGDPQRLWRLTEQLRAAIQP
jgi:NAD(P)-dependent dehydrogenase (short-subunit alcohol dehydrogenase family)